MWHIQVAIIIYTRNWYLTHWQTTPTHLSPTHPTPTPYPRERDQFMWPVQSIKLNRWAQEENTWAKSFSLTKLSSELYITYIKHCIELCLLMMNFRGDSVTIFYRLTYYRYVLFESHTHSRYMYRWDQVSSFLNSLQQHTRLIFNNVIKKLKSVIVQTTYFVKM